MEKSASGYPSIDRPQEQYYRTEPIREIDENQILYDLVFNANAGNIEYDALGYFGNTTTYERLKKEVNRLASAYRKLGVKEGDVVTLGVINSPEVALNLLALNAIGAVSKWVDVRASSKDLEHYINDHGSKTFIAFDQIVPKLESIIDNTDISNVIVVSPSDSLSAVQRILYGIQNRAKGTSVSLPEDQRFQRFNDFEKSGDLSEEIERVPFDKERPSVIIQSSGTTGKAKSIVHPDYSFTSFVKKIAYSDLPFAPAKSLLVAVPPWIGYGLANSLYLSLGLGMKAELCPKFDPDIVFSKLGKFNFAFAAPFHYRYLADNASKIKPEDLKKIECLISGGDKISIEELEYMESILGIKIINGYGNNEGLGAETFNPDQHNKFGTVGIPKYGDTVIAYDTEAQRELKYGEIGEVCVNTDTMFLGYANNPEETDRIKKLHPDGKYWIHTGDLGSIDEEGFLSLQGRASRVIVRLGFKLSPMTIESAVEKSQFVKECIAVPVEDSEEEHVPLLFVVVKDEFKGQEESIRGEIELLCSKELKENEIPKHIVFVDSLPYTDNNKYDFMKLEEIGNQYVRDNLQIRAMKKVENKQ